jgi:hypothetical protein
VQRNVKVDCVGGLFRGVPLRSIYMALGVAVFSLGYEASKKYVAEKKRLWRADVAHARYPGERR